MSVHAATVTWSREGARFTDLRYSRAHRWSFDGGVEVPASSSPDMVRVPMSDASAVDPEEALVAAAAACHMLWFLSTAAAEGWIVDSYTDEAEGRMGTDDRGRQAITRIVLRPRIAFGGDAAPTAEELDALHERAHERCNVANSLRSAVVIEPPALPG